MQDQNDAGKVDYTVHEVRVNDHECADSWPFGSASALTDALGAERFPAAWRVWTRTDPPTPEKPASVVLDYPEPIAVTALAHYFHVPGNRDHRWRDYLCGPAAFAEVRILVSDDQSEWQEVAHLTDLPAECPQLLRIPSPRAGRYLRLEVLSLAEGASGIRSYELDTYTGAQPYELAIPEGSRAVRRGYPNAEALEPTTGPELPAGCALCVRIDSEQIMWQPEQSGSLLVCDVSGGRLRVSRRAVRAGVLLEFGWDGPTTPPFHQLTVLAGLDQPIREWCLPGYHFSRTRPEAISIASAVVPTAVSIVGDGSRTITLVPDTDCSWVGLDGDCATCAFPLNGETARVLILESHGGWQSGLRKAVQEVFGFEEPRQFSPVSRAIPELCRFILRPEQWSDRYQMLRSFPDTDFFYLFYSLPYAIPALTMWETMTGDRTASQRIDSILRFMLDRRLTGGPMAGAVFSEYADCKLCEEGEVPFGYSPFYQWYLNYPEEELIGMDQGCSRWITSHNMGAMLWTITYVWQSRGDLSHEVLEGACDLADWMLRTQREDGSWPYSFCEDGSVASPMSDSGTIWNVWSLWRFGRLTGCAEYTEAAEKATKNFRETFTANHLYRGYWEDIYGGGKTELNSAQGYESSLAAMAFAEMGDKEAAISSAQDAMRFVCTRVLECRDYWTSYGGVAEQQNWAPGTYIAPTFGYAAHLAWRLSGDDFFRPFASIAKTIGWWQDPSGGAFWLSAAVSQQPIEALREEGGGRQFWALWDSAQKVAFALPWLVDEANRRTNDAMQLNTTSLQGTDDRGADVIVSLFDGEVESGSGQVNWLGLRDCLMGRDLTCRPLEGEYQLVLMNHAEATQCRVRATFGSDPTAARAFDDQGRRQEAVFTVSDGEVTTELPERWTVVLVW